jgi:hypothetical protein
MVTIDSHDQVVLDKNYTIGTVLQTINLNNVAIQLSGTINLSPRVYALSEPRKFNLTMLQKSHIGIVMGYS